MVIVLCLKTHWQIDDLHRLSHHRDTPVVSPLTTYGKVLLDVYRFDLTLLFGHERILVWSVAAAINPLIQLVRFLIERLDDLFACELLDWRPEANLSISNHLLGRRDFHSISIVGGCITRVFHVQTTLLLD